MFSKCFEKTAQLKAYPAHLDQVAHDPTATIRDADDKVLETARLGYLATHDPKLELLAEGSKMALPVGIIAALASPRGKRLKNALALGGLAGLGYGAPKAARQWYANKLEDAHIKYHLDRMGYVPGK
jgi:hypothetical protein